jgi:hypothetical protein
LSGQAERAPIGPPQEPIPLLLKRPATRSGSAMEAVFQMEHLQPWKALMSHPAPVEREQTHGEIQTDDRSAYAQATKRQDGAMREMLGMGPDPAGDPEPDKHQEPKESTHLASSPPPSRAIDDEVKLVRQLDR